MKKHRFQTDPATRLALALLTCLVMFWSALVIGGCGPKVASESGTPDSSTEKPRIVTTTGMVGDMVRTLVGSDATVDTMMGPGVDPHLYQPSRSDSVQLLRADIVVYNGLHLEGRLGDVLAARAKSGRPTIAVGETLSESKLLEADAGTHDPHIWMDVSLWNQAMKNVTQQLALQMPASADQISERSRNYAEELRHLDQRGAAAMESVPSSQRVLVTAHDAFRYYGKRYGIEVHGVQGVSTISEAAIRDVNRLVNMIVERKVPAVFFESSVSGRQVQAIVEGARNKGQEVSSDWELFSDSMGATGTPAGTYLGMMEHNFRTIATALGGNMPSKEETSDVSDGHPLSLQN